MGDNYRNEGEEYEYVANYLLENDMLEGAYAGIAKQVSGKGYESLSVKQKELFDNNIIPMIDRECKQCGGEIPYSEFDSIPYCGWCEHQVAKLEKE